MCWSTYLDSFWITAKRVFIIWNKRSIMKEMIRIRIIISIRASVKRMDWTAQAAACLKYKETNKRRRDIWELCFWPVIILKFMPVYPGCFAQRLKQIWETIVRPYLFHTVTPTCRQWKNCISNLWQIEDNGIRLIVLFSIKCWTLRTGKALCRRMP